MRARFDYEEEEHKKAEASDREVTSASSRWVLETSSGGLTVNDWGTHASSESIFFKGAHRGSLNSRTPLNCRGAWIRAKY